MIPTTNTSLADVQNEFSGSNPIRLDEYYVNGGGGYVIGGQYTTILGNPPSSGPISLGDFRGVSKITTFTFNDVVSVNTANYNLYSRATAAGWSGAGILLATVTINPGVYVYSTSTLSPAFTVGALPAGSTVSITNNGIIAGKGGFGGTGGSVNAAVLTNGTAGAGGGIGASFAYPVTFANNGTIGGGGGGGGGGGAARNTFDSKFFYGGSGGGGGGGRSRFTGDGGEGPPGTSTGNNVNGVASYGGTGTLAAPGAGGNRYVISGVIGTGFGGAGGNLGQPGVSGTGPDMGFVAGGSSLPGAGGAAGLAVTGGANVTWTAFGTRLTTLDHPGINATGGGPVNFGARSLTGSYLSTTARSVFLNIYTDGDLQGYTHGNVLQFDTSWYSPESGGIGASYWVRATLTSGVAPSSGDALGVWHQLNATRGWTYTAPGTGVYQLRQGTLSIEISSSPSGSPVVSSGSCAFYVERES
jgi:hypothetical protein